MTANTEADINPPFGNNKNRKRRLKNIILNIHPERIPKAAIKFTNTWGLGGMALVLFILQIFTGILLRFQYEPSTPKAFQSIVFMQDHIVFGQIVRNIHHWSGMFMIIASFLHLLRAFLSGAFLPPRQWNWIIGICLFLGLIFINFTGYLLPWDQLSYWAVTVSTSMLDYVPLIGEWLKTMIRGGPDVGEATLRNFYTFHTAVLPVTLVILMVVHFWKVRKAGGVKLSGNSKPEDIQLINSYPSLFLREGVAALVLLAFILLFSLLFDAPLLDKANPAFSPNPAKSPWYFQGIQELILHFHPFFAVVVIPLLLLTGVVYIPFLKYRMVENKSDFTENSFIKIILWSSLTGLIVTPLLVILDEYVLHFQERLTLLHPLVSEGLIPFAVLALLTWSFVFLIKKKLSNRKIDLVLALFTLFTISYLILMLIGTFYRGEGMKLVF
nr:cytochrome b N-terminal domain-containing protein [Bacteroidota bacterium]